MKRKLTSFSWLSLVLLGLVLIPLSLSLLIAEPVQAQCGASASSCKNCHEVNAKYPVNTSGDWHISHAFGDFCAFCHAGNVQAIDEAAAHEGMIYPLSDLAGGCQSCHPADYTEMGQIYATALGTTIGGSGESSPAAGSTNMDLAAIVSEPIPAPGERHATGALIDYNRRYDIEVLGIIDTSQLGNLILVVIGIALLVVGGWLVWRFEKFGETWRAARAVPQDDWRRLAYSGAYDVRGPVTPAQKSAPPVELPRGLGIESLDSQTQATLRGLLANPEYGASIIQALGRLDPALINGLQSLDKKDRDLLLAIVEQLSAKE